MSVALTSPMQTSLEDESLRPVFQPIFDLRRQRFLGYEGLIRGPSESALESPLALFRHARRIGKAGQVEQAAHRRLLEAFAGERLRGNLFLNCSADLLFAIPEQSDILRRKDLPSIYGLHPSRIVLEITELERARFGDEFMRTLDAFRRLGYRFAIDDLGEGFSNARLWNELRPDVVKVDRHFIAGIDRDPFKRKFVKAIQGLAEDFGVLLIAEGVETAEELRAVRDLRVQAAQGFFIEHPSAEPAQGPSEPVLRELERAEVTMPGMAGNRSRQPAVATVMEFVEPVTLTTTANDVFARFEDDATLEVLPVADSEGRARGVIHRYHFLDSFARPYRRELFGRKSCEGFMEAASLEIESSTSIQETAMQLAQQPSMRRLSGILVVEGERYLGLVTVQQLMAAITEMQVAAARYANPLTELPGNVPINEQIDSMLSESVPFVASYIDIDHFKPFNDHYGYSSGDDLILALARLLGESCDARHDFVGHVGGDDFCVLLQSRNWETRLRGLHDPFERAMRHLCNENELSAGGFHGTNRKGESVFHPLPTLSIAVVRVAPGDFESHRELADWLARAKAVAKRERGNSFFIERRSPSARDRDN